MELDWDLHAVVRGCSTTSTTTTTSSSMSSSSSSSGFGTCGGFSYIFDSEQQQQQQQSHVFPLSSWSSSIEELHELCKPFFTKSQPQQQLQVQSFQASSPLSSFSYTSSASPQPKLSQAQEKQQQRNKHPHPAGSITTPRSKRRKNQMKRVCQVPVENLSSDIWAWRKYGQKPIKGSPYPRGYYRCSSSKGCLARKQVERNRSDPTMFIVTYTAEHNHPAPTHRNSLAGSTRQKPLTPQGTATATTTGGESEKALTTKPSSSPSTPCGEEEDLSKGEKSSESREEEIGDEEGDDDFGLSDMVLPDDFFECLDELSQLTGPDAVTNGDCFSDPFSAMPAWVANSAAAAAAGGR